MFGRHPHVLQLCSQSCQVLAEGRVVRRVSVSHRITEESGGLGGRITGTTEIIILRARYYAQKVCAGSLEILCTT